MRTRPLSRTLMWIFLSVLLGSSFAPAAEKIRLTNGEWPPYLSENIHENGFASHVVRLAFEAVDIEVEYGFFPWPRSYRYALTGRGLDSDVWHGTVIWSYTPERAADFYFSDLVQEDKYVLFSKTGLSDEYNSFDDLYGKHIGATAHTAYPIFERAEKLGLLTIERSGNYDDLLKKLLYRDIDAFPIERQVGKYYIATTLNADEQQGIQELQIPLETRKHYLILSKQLDENIRLMELFNRGLKIIRDNGIYDQLLNDLENGRYNY